MLLVGMTSVQSRMPNMNFQIPMSFASGTGQNIKTGLNLPESRRWGIEFRSVMRIAAK